MLLTFNISNREITLGFVSDGNLTGTVSVSNDGTKTADEYACLFKALIELRGYALSDFDGSLGASVDPAVTDTVIGAISQLIGIKVHLLGTGTKTGLNILTDDPSQLGTDLVASAVGALNAYKPPMILINLGVATTFSVIDKDGAFAGCAIAPGVTLSSEALSSHASLLPHISQNVPKKCIGTNTKESMQSGSVFGSASMIDGMIERIEGELGYSAAIVVSGGKLADCIVPFCKRKLTRDDTLLHSGLGAIYRKNERKSK